MAQKSNLIHRTPTLSEKLLTFENTLVFSIGIIIIVFLISNYIAIRTGFEALQKSQQAIDGSQDRWTYTDMRNWAVQLKLDNPDIVIRWPLKSEPVKSGPEALK